MEPTFVEKGPIHLVGAVTEGEVREIVPQIGSIWTNRYMPMDSQLKPYSIDNGYYGAWFNLPDGRAAYLTGMAVENLPALPENAQERTIPAARYALFTCTVQTIGPTYQHAYETWLPASPYEYDMSAADFEYYPPGSDTDDAPAQVFIPIKVKQTQAV